MLYLSNSVCGARQDNTFRKNSIQHYRGMEYRNHFQLDDT